MFLIVTGPDLAGKSTIVSSLNRSFRPDVLHKGVRPKDSEEAEATLWRVLFDHVRNNKSYICDRLNYPDELIYASIFSKGEHQAQRLIDQEAGIVRMLKEMHAYTIYVTAPPEVILERLKKRGDEHIDASMVHDIDAAYEKHFENYPLPYTRIDTSIYNEHNAFEKAWRDALYYYSEAVPNKREWMGTRK